MSAQTAYDDPFGCGGDPFVLVDPASLLSPSPTPQDLALRGRSKEFAELYGARIVTCFFHENGANPGTRERYITRIASRGPISTVLTTIESSDPRIHAWSEHARTQPDPRPERWT